MKARLICTLAVALLGVTACASNTAQVASKDRPVHGAVSVTSESELNSDNKPAVKRTGLNADPDNSAGVARATVTSVYERDR